MQKEKQFKLGLNVVHCESALLICFSPRHDSYTIAIDGAACCHGAIEQYHADPLISGAGHAIPLRICGLVHCLCISRVNCLNISLVHGLSVSRYAFARKSAVMLWLESQPLCFAFTPADTLCFCSSAGDCHRRTDLSEAIARLQRTFPLLRSRE